MHDLVNTGQGSDSLPVLQWCELCVKRNMEAMKKSKVLIVGGSSGIGASLAKMLKEDGADIIVIGREHSKLEKLKKDLPAAQILAVDARDRTALDEHLRTIGKIDHLVLTLSGGKGGGMFKELPLQDLREGFEGKFWPQLNVLQATLPYVKTDGSVTLVSATSAGLSMPGTSGLAAINGALDMMIPILSAELKPMRVNAVSPGMIDTPWWDFLPEDSKRQVFKDFSTKVYVGRIGRPEEVADTIRFILKNGYINGTIIRCDGGLS
jgi:NAD(P)-dependent dehydrogenase (short-subunit alcohol dehydrogenase family)